MNSDRNQRITSIFHSAIEREGSERRAFLDGACANDEELRREVESLIRSHENAGSLRIRTKDYRPRRGSWPWRSITTSWRIDGDLLPHIATCADDIALIRSMHTDQFNHHPGQLMMQCGSAMFGRPTMGSWISYGLGSENKNLPTGLEG